VEEFPEQSLDILNEDNQFILRSIGARQPEFKEFLCKISESLNTLSQSTCVKWLEAVCSLSNADSPWAAKGNPQNATILSALESKQLIVFEDGTRKKISEVLDPSDQMLFSIFSDNTALVSQKYHF
jgi:hypothetical protein